MADVKSEISRFFLFHVKYLTFSTSKDEFFGAAKTGPYETEKEHNPKMFFSDTQTSDVREFFGFILFVLDALPYVCMVRCGRSAVLVRSCKPHTIEDDAPCHAVPRL